MQLQLDQWPLLSDVVGRFNIPGNVCPVCNNGISIYKNNSKSSEWVVCNKCTYTGTPLDLATYYTNKSEDEIIGILIPKGRQVTSAAKKMYEKQRNLRKEIIALWERSIDNLLALYADHRPFLARLNVPEMTKMEWDARGGPVVGLIHLNEIPLVLKTCFPKAKFRVALISVFYDMPHHPSGIHFFYENKGELWQKTVYINKQTGISANYSLIKEGLSKTKLYLFLNMAYGIKFMNNYMSVNLTRPNVAMAQEETLTLDGLFKAEDVVLIVEKATHEVIRHAKALNAKIFVANTTWEKSPFNTMKLVTASNYALSWQNHVEKIALSKDRVELSSLISSTRLTANDIKHIQEISSIESAAILENEIKPQKIEFNSSEIEEREEGWYDKQKNRYISNFCFTVNELLTTKANPTIIYRCTVRYKGEDHSLLVSAAEIKIKNQADIVINRMLERRLPLWIESRFERNLINMGKKFGNPQVTFTDNFILGYDINSHKINFPEFSFDLVNRSVKQQKILIPGSNNISWPGPSMVRKVSKEEFDELDKCTRRIKNLFWNLVSFTVASILAPAVRAEKRALLISDNGVFEKFVNFLNVRPFKPENIIKGTIKKIGEVADTGYYPVFVDGSISDAQRQDIILNAPFPVIMSSSRPLSVIGSYSEHNIFSLVFWSFNGTITVKHLQYAAELFNPVVADVLNFMFVECKKLVITDCFLSADKLDRTVWTNLKRYYKSRNSKTLKIKSKYMQPSKFGFFSIISKLIQDGKIPIMDKFVQNHDTFIYKTGQDMGIYPTAISRIACPYTPEITIDKQKLVKMLEKHNIYRGTLRRWLLAEMILIDKLAFNNLSLVAERA